eukprot:CAMPEP_0115503640 /NCGR_PEP_ID=MMETSP0271-20121206/69585_1 /TAXON_ID=71861 /ORGANISM="Scrippsiella trochoidea, Strain CCMP3099" /LENGTH=285 /DNA_ID=CAMNT_0002932747 /DNA_START=152 /DNA_END=1008 /DNA_ORIENTATION=+
MPREIFDNCRQRNLQAPAPTCLLLRFLLSVDQLRQRSFAHCRGRPTATAAATAAAAASDREVARAVATAAVNDVGAADQPDGEGARAGALGNIPKRRPPLRHSNLFCSQSSRPWFLKSTSATSPWCNAGGEELGTLTEVVAEDAAAALMPAASAVEAVTPTVLKSSAKVAGAVESNDGTPPTQEARVQLAELVQGLKIMAEDLPRGKACLQLLVQAQPPTVLKSSAKVAGAVESNDGTPPTQEARVQLAELVQGLKIMAEDLPRGKALFATSRASATTYCSEIIS